MILALSTTGLAAQDTLAPFVVGVWGQDDAIIPFADFDGRNWQSSWREATDTEPDLPQLQQIPREWWGRAAFQPSWEVVEPNGRRREVQIVGTDSAGMGSSCSVNVALTTNLPKETYGYGTVLATSRPGVLAPVELLTTDSAEWRAVSALLPAVYRQHEAPVWRDQPAEWRPDMTPPLPRPTLAAVFAFTDAQGEYLYFESFREFTEWPARVGYDRTFITGWLWRRSSASPFQAVMVRAGMRDGDGKGDDSFHPLGVVRYGARQYWIGSLSSYASGALTVLDVRRNGIKQLVTTGYGGC